MAVAGIRDVGAGSAGSIVECAKHCQRSHLTLYENMAQKIAGYGLP